MATPFSDVFDLFTQQIEDYRLIELYNGGAGEVNFNLYLLGFMTLAIPEFIGCTQNLSNRDDALKTFNFDMTEQNKKGLSKLMVKEWLGKEVKDILQMRWNITDRDFKHYSESQNLREKQSAYNMLNEECAQWLTSYQLLNNDWQAWVAGDFMGTS